MPIRYFSAGIVLLSIVFIVGGGCRPKDAAPTVRITEDKTIGADKPVIVTIPTPPVYPIHEGPGFHYFDWEASDAMPAPSGTTEIPAPWNPEAQIAFNEDMRYDIKKADGWELYMTSFNSDNVIQGPQNFILYNKYRGVLRFYEFNSFSIPDNLSDYDLLATRLMFSGTDPSPLLKFSGNEVIDFDVTQESISTLEPQRFIESGWQAIEFEMAFDKNIYLKTSENTAFYFSAGMIKPIALEIDGVQATSLTTRISSKEFDFTQGGYGYTGDAFLNLRDQSELQGAKQFLSTEDFSILNEVSSGNYSDQFLNGAVQNNGGFGLNWITNFNLSCDPSRVGIFGNLTEYVSGADNSMGGGPPFYYQDAMGVFYLDQKPIVKHSILAGSSTHQYTLDVPSVKYLFNPGVTATAEIQNITQEVVASADSILSDGKRNKLFSGQTLSSNVPITIQGVRVSFDVVPHEGSSKVHIVKTFVATVLEQ